MKILLLCLIHLTLCAVEIRAIIITEDPVERDFSNVRGVVSDVVPAEIVTPYLGEEISKETMENLRETVRCYFKEEGQYGTSVFFPKQNVNSGVVVLSVRYAKVESVCISGNRWGSDSFYENQLGVYPGDRLQTPEALERIAWYNRNPFRYAEMVVAPTGANAVNVELMVKDRFAFRPFAGADNTGTNVTDQVRLFAGVNWGKAFGRPDLLTYQYITATNPHEFYAHTGSYLIFLPWKHELTFYGGFSAIHPDIPSFSHEGISVQASMRYGIPLGLLSSSTQQTLTWGLDYKNINSNVFFIEVSPAIPVVAQQVNISQFYLSYAWQNHFLVKLEAYYSPGKLLPHQSDERYGMLRPDSSAHYFYGRAALADIYGEPANFSFSWLLRGQGATGPLLPSEQFILGGYDTIRGYKERDFIADNAICANLELRAPRLGFWRKDELIFLAFSDIGAGYNYKSELSSQKHQYLWSAGLGARYRVASYMTLRADYGFQLHHIFGQNALGRFHLGGYLSY